MTAQAPVPKLTALQLASLSIATLALTGCSGLSGLDGTSETDSPLQPSSATQIYQYDDLKVASASNVAPATFDGGNPLVIRLSDELQKAAPPNVNIAVDHFTITAKSFSSGVCRTDVKISYADGGFDALRKAAQEARRMNVEKARKALDEGSEYVDEANATYVEPTVEDFIPAHIGPAEIVEKLPSDDSLKNDAWYLLEDGSGLTVTEECEYGESVVSLSFDYPSVNEGLYGTVLPTRSLATTDITVFSESIGAATTPTLGLKSVVNASVGVTGSWAQSSD